MNPPPFQPPARTALVAKLAPPAAGRSHLSRTPLVERICSTPGGSTVLVRAPAGFGKTTLMEQCRRHAEALGTPTAWLNLDPSDNDPSRFLTCLAAALEPLTRGPDAAAGLPRLEPSGLTLIDLIERLARRSAPCTLFIDELESVQASPVLALLRELIDHLPPRVRLVIGSRLPPALVTPERPGEPGQTVSLLEVTSQHLRFSLAETSSYITTHRRIALTPDELQRLHQRTEGWPVALWLASLALERREDRPRFIECFSGAHTALTDYLTDSILARQPAAIRDFLLRTSILRHLSAPLCEALMPGIDGAALLRQLADADILLAPLEGEQGVYRYHSLFSDFLQAQLQREMAQEVPGLHQAASAWYVAARRPVPAIEHALAGGHHAQALGLLQRHAPQLVAQGRMRLLARCAARVPTDMLAQYPKLQAQYLWAVTFTQGADAAKALMNSFGLEHTRDPALRAFMLPLRPMLLAMQDRLTEAMAASQACQAELPTPSRFADNVLRCTAAHLHIIAGEVDQARQQLQAAREPKGQPATAFLSLLSETAEGLLDWRAGRLQQARQRMQTALIATRRNGRGEPNGNAWAGVHHAFILYECNELEAAEQLMRAYVPLVRDLGLADLMILSHTVLARIAFQQGRAERAFRTLVDLEYLGLDRRLRRVTASASLERARLLQQQKHWQIAREALERAVDPTLWQHVSGQCLVANEVEDLALGRLRFEVAVGRGAEGLPQIEQALTAARAAARHTRALKLQLLQAMALAQAGQVRNSHRVLAELLEPVSHEGFVRLVVDEGPQAGQLLRDFALARAQQRPAPRDAVWQGHLQKLLAASGLDPVPPLRDTAAWPVERLTPKEMAVLQLVADGYSDADLAQKLFISPSTVRTHLRSLYGKLDVRNRIQAVAVARRAHMI